MRRISGLEEYPLASQEGLCSIEILTGCGRPNYRIIMTDGRKRKWSWSLLPQLP